MDRQRREKLGRSNPLRVNLADLADVLEGDETGHETAPENALVPVSGEPGCYLYKGCKITPVGVVIPVDAPQQVWKELGDILLDMESAITFALGDWLAFGEDRRWGETYQKMAVDRGLEIATLWSYASVCRKTLIRNQGLSFAHHRKVMALRDPNTGEKLEGDALAAWQEYWLNEAAQNEWTVSQLDAAINGEKPPPPSPKDDPVGFMDYTLTKVRRRLPQIKKLDSGYRMQIATLLRRMADEYDGGVGG